ncbi:ABC transporter permease [Rhodospira trueperi]|uniref:Peptide/nickel transport system permease protein n=1 Tax=Rhodospira trueperi TaxID=69960 RepID=A0A1G7APE2_9PROT|nr:ABC transporter permease [Rhodospira trueperi]SDE15875.1 peptide/nickel transport system permease protein [Rhodospira trueperi]
MTTALPTDRKTWRVDLGDMPPSVLVSAAWVSLMAVIALLADVVAPYDYQDMDLLGRLKPPVWMDGGTWAHPLGTDDLGRDVLSRIIESLRISLFVALLGTLIGAVLGTVIGFTAAHFRGWVDHVVMVLIDFQAALPFIILALAVLAFFGNSFVLFVLVMGVYGWERYARIVRGLALSASSHGYAVAVRTLGANPVRVYLRHILPNMGSAIIVNMTLNFPETILVETSLSFLGLGIQPPLTSLGNMVGFGRDYLLTAWWIAVLPSIVIFVTTLAFSLLGDWLRDRLDPTLRGT